MMETDWIGFGIWHAITLPIFGFVVAFVWDENNAPPLRPFPDRPQFYPLPRVERPFPNPRPTTPVPPYLPLREAAALPIFQGSPPE